jgi:hypothetical protein
MGCQVERVMVTAMEIWGVGMEKGNGMEVEESEV